jgi:hypothetical protein
MNYQGTLAKMLTQHTHPVQYLLPIGLHHVHLNALLGQTITLHFSQHIYCTECGAETPKSLAHGLCYKCFTTSPLAEDCVLRPELCQAHLGIARNLDYAQTHCLIPHYVYLALSSDVKVGVTRHTQIPTRWIDQGATQAIKLAQTPDRHTAGLIEVALKQHLPDKTNWQRMLKNQQNTQANLLQQKEQAYPLIPDTLRDFVTDDDTLYTFQYPVTTYPTKITSLTFDKQPHIQATLQGIKGQYLIFADGQVLNIRKHTGYHITLQTHE